MNDHDLGLLKACECETVGDDIDNGGDENDVGNDINLPVYNHIDDPFWRTKRLDVPIDIVYEVVIEPQAIEVK